MNHKKLLTLKEMQDRLAQMSYRDYEMSLYEGVFEGIKFKVVANERDTDNPDKMVTLTIVSPCEGFFTTEQFDLWVAKRLIRIAIHECLEELKLNGVPLYSPHRENADQDLFNF